MKKYLSVFMLFARSTIYRLLALWIAATATEAVLFWFAMQSNVSLEETFIQSRIPWVYGISFILLTFLLSMPGCNRGAKTGYTLHRLQVDHKAVFFCQAVYNGICYFIFWIAQLFLILWLFQRYTATADASYVGTQSLFLAFYRNNFLHSLLPLAEATRYLRNIILILCLGITTAHYPLRQRTGKSPTEIIVLVCLILPFFPSGIGTLSNDLFLSAVSIIMMARVLSGVFAREAQYEA